MGQSHPAADYRFCGGDDRNRSRLDHLALELPHQGLVAQDAGAQHGQFQRDDGEPFGFVRFEETIVSHGLLETSMAYLQKPFTTEALARKTREVLDA